MLITVKKIGSLGVEGNPVRVRRQIELCNQLGLFGALATIPYQLFYIGYDLGFYRGIFTANLLFMVAYLSVLPLNYCRFYRSARKLLVVNACIQLFVVTLFISAEAGVHLFYFCLASILVFLFEQLRVVTYLVLMTLVGALYITAHFMFPLSVALTPVPSPWVDVMYVASVAGVLSLQAGLLYLLRQQIDSAEDELTHKNEHLEVQSNTDPLTGLANRRLLDRTLEREWSRLAFEAGELSLIMCDIDHFKRFNDRYGHGEGDKCLERIAAALELTFARPTDLVARYGGEEFACVLPFTDEQGARYLGEKLVEAVRDLNILNADTHAGRVTISVGVSSIAPSCRKARSISERQLLNCADQALYQAKAQGRDQVAFLACQEAEHSPERPTPPSDRRKT